MDRFVLIGAGGTGSHFVAPALAYLHARQQNLNRDWEFLVIDGDNYEHKNLERQLFDPGFVGTNKATALASMYDRYPIKDIPKFIGRNDLAELITENSVVFLGVDNFSVRALIEEHALTLQNIVVVNAGNEKSDGSVQLFVRENGENKTPLLSFCHPEIEYKDADDRSNMTCAQAALIPGGEQLILANFSAAQGMLHALYRYHTGAWKSGWTELNFDLEKNSVEFMDFRERKGWGGPIAPAKNTKTARKKKEVFPLVQVAPIAQPI